MKFRQRIIRNRHDTDAIWGDLLINEGPDVNRELRRSISRRIFIATFTIIAVILSSFWFWVHRIDSAQANVPAVVEKASASLVDIWCGRSGGTAVSMNIPIPKKYKSALLTAAHVLDNCPKGSSVKVTYEGRDYTGYVSVKDPVGKVTDTEKQSDLALVFLKNKIPGLDPAPEARIGDWAIVMGDPYEHINYVTVGIVTDVDNEKYGTDAAVNHGNSGGPLLDSSGRVLGIISYGEEHSNQFENNPNGIWDRADGINYAKRLKLGCLELFANAQSCPFRD